MITITKKKIKIIDTQQFKHQDAKNDNTSMIFDADDYNFR